MFFWMLSCLLLPSHLTLRKPYASLLSFLLTLFVVQVDIIASPKDVVGELVVMHNGAAT